MAKKSLADQIKERKKGMKDKNINGKACYIATLLGHKTNKYDSRSGCEETWHIFENENFRIEDYGISCTDAGGFHREVKYKGKVVFYMSGGGEESFIPGEWEKELNRLYALAQRRDRKAKKEEEAEIKRIQAAREKEERKKWGL